MEIQKEKKIEDIVKDLFEAGAHFGYKKSRRHPSVRSFIFGQKNKVDIFDLEKTAELLLKAKDFVREKASANEQILFVSGKNEAKYILANASDSIDMPYVAGRWIGGTLTNFSEIRKRVERLEDLISQKEKGELAKYTKKERLLIDREIEKLKKMFEGIIPLKSLPKALFVIDTKKENIAVREAKFLKIPIISLSGSDCNVEESDYFIPANDSLTSSIRFFVGEIASAYKEGKLQTPKKEDK